MVTPTSIVKSATDKPKILIFFITPPLSFGESRGEPVDPEHKLVSFPPYQQIPKRLCLLPFCLHDVTPLKWQRRSLVLSFQRAPTHLRIPHERLLSTP